MKIKIRLIVLIFFSISSYLGNAQNNINKIVDSLLNNSVKSDSVSKYYELVFDAELLITKRNFNKASDKYFEAFNYLDFPFQRDLIYALDCELLSILPNKRRLIYYVELINKKYGGKEFIEGREFYCDLLKNPDIIQILKTEKSLCDTSFVNKCNEIIDLDQAIRLKSKNENQGVIYNSNYNDTIEYIDSINYFFLVKTIQELDIFSEEVYGGLDNWNKLFVLFLHNPERKEILPVLHKNVMEGHLDARQFAAVLKSMEYKYNNKYILHEFGFYLNGKVFWTESYGKDTLLEINRLRNSIYLNDYTEQLKKIEWAYKNPKYNFKFNSLSYLVGMTDDEFYPLVLNYANNKESKTLLFFKNYKQKKRIIRLAREWELQNKND